MNHILTSYYILLHPILTPTLIRALYLSYLTQQLLYIPSIQCPPLAAAPVPPAPKPLQPPDPARPVALVAPVPANQPSAPLPVPIPVPVPKKAVMPARVPTTPTTPPITTTVSTVGVGTAGIRSLLQEQRSL